MSGAAPEDGGRGERDSAPEPPRDGTPGNPADGDPAEPTGLEGHEAPPKLRDAALVLPLLGVFLLLPPFPEIFMAPLRIAGVPLIVIYIFGVWLALILAALWLARRLQGRGQNETRHPPGSRGQAEFRSQRDGWRADVDRRADVDKRANVDRGAGVDRDARAEPEAGPGPGRD